MSDIPLSLGMKTNLLSLQRTQKMFDSTQERMSTGKRVSKPVDDPANFYAAATLNNRAKDLENRLDGMGQAVQSISAADNGIQAMRSVLDSMKAVVENALNTKDEDISERKAMGKQFNKLIVQLNSFAGDSAYGGINLLVDEQTLDVQMGQKYDESVLSVQGFHVHGVKDVDEDGEVSKLDPTELPNTWKIDSSGATGAVLVGDYSSMNYDPLDRSTWTRFDNVDKVAEGTASGRYNITYTDGTTQSVSGIAKLEEINGSYWGANETTNPVPFGGEVSLYSFALNKVENPTQIVGIKSYGTDQTTITGHEVDWGKSQSFRDDLKTVLKEIESVDEVLKTRSKLFSFDSATVTLREEYTQDFINALETGADKLTLADLNEEAANLLSLQTAQQLGVQALSLTNQQTQGVLRLLG